MTLNENKIIWKTEKKKLKDLKFFEGNPRKTNEKQKQDLKNSLERFNLADPLIINTDGTVIGGNFRLRILKEKFDGETEIDIRVPNRTLTRREAEELNLRLNKNQGEWDLDVLANFDEELLKDVGWSGEELDEIFGLEVDEDFDVEKELNKVLAGKKRRCKEGDLWQLGEHRLYIGDATKRESWEKVLGNERFDFLFTDPPYCIGANIGDRKSGYARYEKVKTKKGFGLMSKRKYIGLIERGGVPEYDEWLSIANEFQNPKGANVMVFENWKNTVKLWQAIEKYWKIRNMVIWWLPNRHQGFSAKHKFFSKYDIAPLAGEGVLNEEYEEELENYLKEKGQKLLDTYEIILYGQKGESYWDRGKKGGKWAKIADHITWTAETEASSGQNVIFGTKPIQILVPYIKILSPRNGIVVDCFGGSGSTLIACEIMKRRCRMIEIEPIYCQVIIDRWEKFTGQKCVKIN